MELRVLSVKKIKESEPVYCMTVPETHTFVVDTGTSRVVVENCCGHSLRDLISRGITGVADKVSSAPAKHLGTLCQQLVNFLGILQNEWAGAQAFSSVDTYLAPFIKIDNLSYKEVYQCCQTLLYGINTPSRWGSQAPFSNFTHDWTVPADMKDKKAIVGGVEQDFTYGDCQVEMDLFNNAFFTLFMEGDAQGRSFQYPIPTINITKGFWEHCPENQDLLFRLTSKFGTPYFQNFISSDMDPADVRSMCCRLRLDKRELRKRGGGLFGSAELTGSVGVVTLNLPRLGYLANDEADFYTRLDDLMDIARDSLEIKRKVLAKNLVEGLYPYTRAYVSSFDNFFSTIGLVGMNEASRNIFGSEVNIGTDVGKRFAIDVLNHMRERIAGYQVETGNLYNLESTPAESTCYRLALHDKKKYPDIIVAGSGEPYYTNSSNLPVGYSDDPWVAIDHQDDIQTLYTGGTVFHAFLGQQIEDPNATKNFIRKVFENSRIPYLTISPVYSICPVHGYLPGSQDHCPKCRDEQVKAYKKKLSELRKKREELEVIG